MQREVVIDKLKSVKSKYQQDGFNIIALFGSYATNSQNNSSDIDLLYEVDNSFLEKYKGFKSVSKVLQIQEELSSLFHTKVDLTSPSGLNQRITTIIEKITHIQNIVLKFDGKVSKALKDAEVFRPAILMHLVAIAEQFDKLKKVDSSLIKYFSSDDLKGVYDIRTFIAHDYDGVNLSIIETAIRYGLPELLKLCNDILISSMKS